MITVSIIAEILLEEYCKLDEKLKHYLSKPLTADYKETIASLQANMSFIENAFRGNGLDFAKELSAFQIGIARTLQAKGKTAWKSQHP